MIRTSFYLSAHINGLVIEVLIGRCANDRGTIGSTAQAATRATKRSQIAAERAGVKVDVFMAAWAWGASGQLVVVVQRVGVGRDEAGALQVHPAPVEPPDEA